MNDFNKVELGGKYLISYPLGAAFAPLMVFGVPLAEINATGKGSFWNWSAASFLGLLVGILLLILADLTVLRNRYREPYPNSYIFILGFVLGAAKGAVTELSATYIFQIPGISESSILERTINSALLGCITFPLIALMVFSWNELNLRRRYILNDLQGLEELIHFPTDDLAQRELASQVAKKLENIRLEFQKQFLNKNVVDPEDAAKYLKTIANSVVRPLSHKLSKQSSLNLKRYRMIIDFSYLIPGISMQSLPWLLTFYATSEARATLKLHGASAGVLILIINSLLLGLIVWSMKEVFERINLRPITFFCLSALAILVHSGLAFVLQNVFDREPFSWHFLINYIWVLMIFHSTCLASIYIYSQMNILSELHRSYSNKYSDVLRKNLTDEVLSYKIARYLHGTIQTRLITSAFRIRNLKSDHELESEFKLIDEHLAIPFLNSSAKAVPLSDKLDRMTAEWGPLVELEIKNSIDNSLVDSNSATKIFDLLNESISNAFRHGQATRIAIALFLAGDQIEISCINNGLPVRQSGSGLGSSLFSQITSFWKLENLKDGTGVELNAAIPLSIKARK